MAKRKWERNIWTGNAIMRISDNVRIVRIGDRGPYYKQLWGDYSAKYPINSPTFATVKLALAWEHPCEGV